MSAQKDYGIDSHKLIYHVDRVNRWLKGENIYPIYVEAAPAGGCNQRCVFCGLDYTGHKPNFLPIEAWKRFVKDAAEKGLKSVLLSGEGEPLLNPKISDFVMSAKKNGLDIAIASNGVLLVSRSAKKLLPSLTWLRISLDAATSKVYSFIHGVDKKQFPLVIKNIRDAVSIKNKERLNVTIGIQFLLLDENYRDVERAARLARELGVDYFSVKPYSKHPLSINEAGTEVDYARLLRLEDRLKKYNSERFNVVFRKGAMLRKLKEKPYRSCLGLPFWVYINSKADVYPCSTFLGLKRYCIGNISLERFPSIWNGERRRRIMNRILKMDARKCRELCRLDEINAYLWRLKHPPEHVNFI